MISEWKGVKSFQIELLHTHPLTHCPCGLCFFTKSSMHHKVWLLPHDKPCKRNHLWENKRQKHVPNQSGALASNELLDKFTAGQQPSANLLFFQSHSAKLNRLGSWTAGPVAQVGSWFHPSAAGGARLSYGRRRSPAGRQDSLYCLFTRLFNELYDS